MQYAETKLCKKKALPFHTRGLRNIIWQACKRIIENKNVTYSQIA